MQKHQAGEEIAESTQDRPAAVVRTPDAKYSRSRRGNGEVTENGPAATGSAGGGNGREPTIRELQTGIEANRWRIIRLEKQTKKEFKRVHRELAEQRRGTAELRRETGGLRDGQRHLAEQMAAFRDIQNQMLGQMRAMVWIIGVIGGVTVATVLTGVLIPAIQRLIAPLTGG